MRMPVPVILFGDINDTSKTGDVRGIAIRAGLKPLRVALKSDKVSGDTLRSFNKWTQTDTLPKDGVWIDEIFTRDVRLEDAALRRTDTDIPYLDLNASDHNGLSVDVLTAIHERLQQINVRRSDLPELRTSRTWTKRRPYMIKYLEAVAASVVGMQECTLTQADDIQAGLGANWSYVGQHHNVRLFFNGLRWDAVEGTEFEQELPSDLRKRHLTGVQLKSRHADFTALFCSVHLAAGGITERNAPALRLKQMQLVVDTIAKKSMEVTV
jgi:hypothetical protein